MESTLNIRKKIAIIEDEAASAEFLESLLENEGYACRVFASGEEALTALNKGEHSDLILLDIMLEGMDGYEVCKILKSDTKLRYIPVIIISGKSSVEEKVLGLKLGADDYLVKPFKNKELLAKIQVLLRIKELQDQLIHTEKLAGIGQLAAGIAHEFNNLIGGMLGYAQLGLMNTEDPVMVKKAFSVIEKSCFRAKELTENMLLFSSNRIKAEASSAVENCLSHCQILLSSELKKNSIVLIKELNHKQRAVIDPNRLLQVFVNLLRNAVQAMEQRQDGRDRLIRIITEDRGPTLTIDILDSGPGIPEAVQERIFDPFFTTKGVLGGGTTGGSGMGLSVVYGIITSHNGSIDLVSSTNRGSRFRITLPAAEYSEPQQLNQKTPHLETAPFPAQIPGNTSVLVVDDEAIYQDLLKDALKKKGLLVETATSGEEAIVICKENHFDIIFMDYLMPGIGGIEAAAILKKNHPDTKIVFITGKTILNNLKESIGDTQDRYLTKPFNLKELDAVIIQLTQPTGD